MQLRGFGFRVVSVTPVKSSPPNSTMKTSAHGKIAPAISFGSIGHSLRVCEGMPPVIYRGFGLRR
jgi:hypothetical protein